ncbi:Xaa-Pro dipeptidase [Oceanobacillus oncorhynchi subsp. incaldanensis]|uniref:M24 family metallopeptidase n=2 Tax=Oceanobacillus TaxID=182709 RepID=A0ABV9K4B1_9BACI|nr:Xaa-Pro peptidase family protein [Oceanobacillus oncorhynchi]MDM8099444.1 Xaa-Pro peptidase family protein [Oceanobacillus oncorhynchi]UUI38432.1 Xaa-Pro peptidase family protein [Oceanobacillus oncorhynchi]GIO20967.1 Xaa-Pro dipeptidase [Oceanobacillus oncorhynchi subsp. incaldanensis]CEI84113.1 putative peptidase [Oceanobacillus oncorhynchi]
MTKLDRLREKLEENKADAIIIDSPYNRRYLTNFTGTAGTALITADKALFITDFRYTEQAAEQAAAFEIIEHKQGMIQEIANQIDKLGVKRLAFEKNYTTYSQFETYQNQFSQELIPVEGIVEALRMIKTPDELEIMKKAAKIADDAFAHIQSFIEPGVKEIDISNELEFFMRRQGATSSSFDTIVASGLRSALPHGVASDKQMAEGELVTLDYGALYEGYCSDITRTVAVGEISAALREIYDIVLEANLRGVKGTKAGMSGKEADALTRDYITEKGYGDRFGHSTGHAVGMEVHESPGLSTRSEAILEPGMVVTVEPGIYVPGVGGCRIEDDIVITKDGNERLTFAPKELIQL